MSLSSALCIDIAWRLPAWCEAANCLELGLCIYDNTVLRVIQYVFRYNTAGTPASNSLIRQEHLGCSATTHVTGPRVTKGKTSSRLLLPCDAIWAISFQSTRSSPNPDGPSSSITSFFLSFFHSLILLLVNVIVATPITLTTTNKSNFTPYLGASSRLSCSSICLIYLSSVASTSLLQDYITCSMREYLRLP